MSDCNGCSAGTLATFPRPTSSARPTTIALVGPPNSGKSTLFNRLTGMRQKVANFPGVTVEHHIGRVQLADHSEALLVDLPGVYSMSPRSEDEQVTHDVLAGEMPGVAKPDAILLILDSTNLDRQLILAAPILSLGIPTQLVLNMADDLHRRGGEIDAAALSAQLGAPAALISAYTGQGVDVVSEFMNKAAAGSAARRAPLMQLPVLNDIPKCRVWATNIGRQSDYHAPAPPLWTRRLDSVFLHPVAGPAIFMVVVAMVFLTIFSGAQPLMNALQSAVGATGDWLGSTLPASPLRSLLVEGVCRGVGSVIVFLPQILLLFLFIGVLEDSGYLARAAVIADRTMSKFGLQGKSFIPLLSAYACAVPAIMATRTIENKRDRIATILIAPFMTCSARLPSSILVIAAFIPDKPGLQAAVLLFLYIAGFAAALATARLLKSTILKSGRTPFMLEMPAYRWPSLRSLGLRLVDRTMVFLKRAGTVILVGTVLLWVLAHVPLHDGHAPAIAESVAGTVGHAMEPVIKPLGFNWRIGIGLLTSLAAREMIVGTLGTIYGMEGDARSVGLQAALHQDLTLGGALALLIFFAFAMQCMSTIAVVRRETGGWKWPAVQFGYMTAMAYVSALLVNQTVSHFF
jgi:ferrous iron transport protein B